MISTRRLLTEPGFDSTTVDEIAPDAGVVTVNLGGGGGWDDRWVGWVER
jgi:hypothetical protein